MTKAVLTNGQIRPVEPLPPDWRDGQELRVEKLEEAEVPPDQVDRDFACLSELCSQGDTDDDARLVQALQDAQQLAKDQVRRSMGLS